MQSTKLKPINMSDKRFESKPPNLIPITFLLLYNYAEHLAYIKFGYLGANMGWLTFSLPNQLSIVRYTADYKLSWQ